MPAFVRRQAPGSPALDPRRIRTIANRMLREVDLEQAELSILLTNDEHIHELNREYRGKDRPTDVLAFPLEEEGSFPDAPSAAGAGAATPEMLGDVIISLDTSLRQAKSRQRELFDEVRFLLAHGVAHLLGYDHGTKEEKREMDKMTKRLVKAARGE